MVLFIAGQLFINYKRGLVISPFYHFGMYSEVMKNTGSYQVVKVEQNGKILRGEDFSTQQWDEIMLPVQYYGGISKNNGLYETDIKRLLGKIGISANDKNFLQQCNYEQFETRYKSYLPQITKQPISSLKVYYRNYHYTAGELTATDSVTMLLQLCR